MFRSGGYDDLSFLDNEMEIIQEELEKLSIELQGEIPPENDKKGDEKTFESIVQLEDEGLRNLQEEKQLE